LPLAAQRAHGVASAVPQAAHHVEERSAAMHRSSAAFRAATCLFTLLLAMTAGVGAHQQKEKDTKLKEPSAAQKKIAKAIAHGHSYEKHVIEEKLFPEVKSEKDFMELIGKVLANPTHQRELENDREAFYDSKSNTIVIYNAHARDKGTCFRPRAGLRYYEGLK
jgi:hypothetical protein